MSGKVIVLEQQMVKSAAWLSLGGTAKDVYLIFRTKCLIVKRQGKPQKRGPVITNNGEIEFTYEEALKKYGMTAPRFKRAIDELVATGFIDIAATGAGTHKVTTLYAISERWKAYGTDEFVRVKRPRRSNGYPGFRKGNTAWQRGLKKKSTDDFVHGAMHTNVHGDVLAMHTNVHGEKVRILYKWSGHQWLPSKIA